MPEVPGSQVGSEETTPTAVAEALEDMAKALADVLPRARDEAVRGTLAECAEQIRQSCAALHRMALLYNPSGASAVAKQGDSLKSLAHAIGETIDELAQTNRRIATEIGDHVGELDKMVEAPPNGRLADQLRAAVVHMRQMAGEMQKNFDTIAAKVRSADENISALEHELSQARQKALHDALTQLHSRAALDEHLDAAVRGGETKGPWSCLLVDIDHFKRVNDTHGHLVGDALLVKVARIIENAVRWKTGKDVLARYGGDEFAIVLAGAKLAEAGQVAERVRQGVAASRWQYRGQPREPVVQVTVTLGVGQYRAGDTVTSLMQRVDDALYRAKKAGRNRVTLAVD